MSFPCLPLWGRCPGSQTGAERAARRRMPSQSQRQAAVTAPPEGEPGLERDSMNIQDRLFALQDGKYRDFNAALIPNVPKEHVIGVRTPELRKLARELSGTAEASAFLGELPHFYLEENHLHGFLIERIKDYDACVAALDAFLPFDHARLIGDARRWLESDRLYTKRFAIRMLMNHFLDEDFRPEYPGWVAGIETEEYYLRMMQAWYFATALAKQYEAALPYIEQKRLESWTHDKAIQKAVESFRVSDERKAYLKTLKVKPSQPAR